MKHPMQRNRPIQWNKSLRRTIFGSLSFATAAFVFQACYGPPQDWDFENQVTVVGRISSGSTNMPLDSIRIWDHASRNYDISNELGEFELWIPRDDSILIHFEALEDRGGPQYERRDTLVTNPDMEIVLDLALKEI